MLTETDFQKSIRKEFPDLNWKITQDISECVIWLSANELSNSYEDSFIVIWNDDDDMIYHFPDDNSYQAIAIKKSDLRRIVKKETRFKKFQ